MEVGKGTKRKTSKDTEIEGERGKNALERKLETKRVQED
jgi:hypothetical protein